MHRFFPALVLLSACTPDLFLVATPTTPSVPELTEVDTDTYVEPFVFDPVELPVCLTVEEEPPTPQLARSPVLEQLERVLDLPVAEPRPEDGPSPRLLVPVVVDRRRSSAVSAWTTADGAVRREAFRLGPRATTPIADFLFVLDPSISMASVVDRVREAFLELARADVFPAGARVGVLSTTPHDPLRPGVPHPAQTVLAGTTAVEPGFQQLVTADRLYAVRHAAPELALAFPVVGCHDGWFTPDQTDVRSVPCLVGATQASQTVGGVEAGLTATWQWVTAADTPPRFREGAVVHVVFVSDTHDPGVREKNPWYDELVKLRPRPETLLRAIEEDQDVAGVRFHAIVPATRACGEMRAVGNTSYLDAVQTTGGQRLDLCTATSYVPFVRALAEDGGRMERPVLALDGTAGDAMVVRVDGRVAAFSTTQSHQVVVLDGRLPPHEVPVDVAYEVAR